MTDEEAKKLRADIAALRESKDHNTRALCAVLDYAESTLPPPPEDLWPEEMERWFKGKSLDNNGKYIFLCSSDYVGIRVYLRGITPDQADWFVNWIQAGPGLWKVMVAWQEEWAPRSKDEITWALHSAITALREEAGR